MHQFYLYTLDTDSYEWKLSCYKHCVIIVLWLLDIVVDDVPCGR